MADSDILEHYGIKGMRWGVRRSDAQLERARGKSAESSDDAKKVSSVARKLSESGGDTSVLTNQDLKVYNERLNLEQNFKNLQARQNQKSKSKGREFAENIVLDVAKETIKGLAKSYIQKMVSDYLGESLKSKAQKKAQK